MKFGRITVNPNLMLGVPCIRGPRIPVATLVGMVADGMSENKILKAFPLWKARLYSRRCTMRPRRCGDGNSRL